VSKKRYEQIIDLADEGIWTLDSNDNTDFINKRGAAILGYSPKEMIGRPTSDFLFPHGVEEVEARRRSTIPGQMTRYEVRGRRQDGMEV
jgi:PAS domain S-box-containing protein